MTARRGILGGMHKRRGQATVLLCGSLYMLEAMGERRPERKRVLSFLRCGLVNMAPTSADEWKDEQGFWVQFFSWCRKDAALEGLLGWLPYVDHGVWRLSDKGRKAVEALAERWRANGSPETTIQQIKSIYGGCLWTEKFAAKLIETCTRKSAG